uniref:Uncharacterized protein n=1 Tax=Aegilops tauschii subsp. strangulata TaxID=200361 RepID=A0A453G874_AEGTS
TDQCQSVYPSCDIPNPWRARRDPRSRRSWRSRGSPVSSRR